MKNLKVSPLIIVVIIVLAIGFVGFYKLKNSPKRIEAFHRDIYDGAKGWFESDLKAELITPETVDPSTRLHVTWNKPTKKYNHFLLTITNKATKKKLIESGEGERVSLDLFNLLPETDYAIALQACLDHSCEKWYVSKTEVSLTTDSAE
jgi:hypothetical protein